MGVFPGFVLNFRGIEMISPFTLKTFIYFYNIDICILYNEYLKVINYLPSPFVVNDPGFGGLAHQLPSLGARSKIKIINNYSLNINYYFFI